MNQQIIQYQNQLRSHQAIRHNNIMRRIDMKNFTFKDLYPH
jgi:hypothetical protein